jgi:hypothetical protein
MSTTDMSIFDTFIAAKQALDELPTVKAELETAKSEIKNLSSECDTSMLQVMERDEEITKLRATLATREAELASATFRETEATAKIANLRSILGPIESVSVVAAEPVTETKPETGSFDCTTADEVGSRAQDEEVKPTQPSPSAGESPAKEETNTYEPTVEDWRSFKTATATLPSLVDPRPFLDRPHWQKPSNISWQEWITKGGERPHWMKEDDLDSLYPAY